MDLIKTIGYDQEEMLQNILTLHVPNGTIDVDLTYGRGVFYKGGVEQPKYKFDIEPKFKDVILADARNVPLKSNSVECVMFDPPFVVGPSDSPGIMRDRYGCFMNVYELWTFYYSVLLESKRMLQKDGIMIFKCQDTVSGGKNWFSHIEIMNAALKTGFYPKDLFLLLAKHRVNSPNMKNQQHARKHHAYFWIFKNRKPRVIYPTLDY